jgi:hypothetical protein
MRWFFRSKTRDTELTEDAHPKRRPERPAEQRPQRAARRERYSGWNDPDLPTYGDPFDG